MQNAINYLLSQIIAVNRKYESILEITGENFNIFRILKLHTAENRTHSAFIAELLNPKGSHGGKDVFLKLFFKTVVSDDFAFETIDAKVIVEKHIGFTNKTRTEGGRLDICLTDVKRQEIFIENKIYAPDQENQLLRYFHYNNKALLLYLTLDDKEVSKFSCGHLQQGKHFQVITYKRDIINWLNECKKESVSHPMLRESIAQYINLIKYLTGQTINDDMNKEIINQLIKDKESLEAAFSISATVDAACDELLVKLENIVEQIAEELNMVAEFNINWKNKHPYFCFYKKNWQLSSILFQFQYYDRDLIYGVGREHECPDLEDGYGKEIFERLSSLGGELTTWWPFLKYIEAPFDNWNNIEPWTAIIDGSIKGFIKERVVEILGLLNEHQL